MHFGFHDVHATRAAVAEIGTLLFLQVHHGTGGGDHGIHDAFRNFFLSTVSGVIQNGRVGHEVTHIAHEQQGAAMQHFSAFAAGLGVHAVCVQSALECFATLLHVFRQTALQDTQPIAVGQHFVF